MKEYKNIDELFKQGMSGLSTEPSPEVWDKISTGFFQGRGFILKWYHITALALLLIVSGGFWYYYSNQTPAEQLTTDDSPIIQNTPESPVQAITDDVEPDETSMTDNAAFDVEETIILNEETESQSDLTEDAYLSENHTGIFNENQSIQTFNIDESGQDDPNINALDSREIELANSLPDITIDPKTVPGLEKYLKKQSHTHFYTGVTAHTGMVYYPSTKDQFTWSADLAFGLKIGSFYIETGLGYESMQERGIYLFELKSYDSVGFYNEVESFEISPHDPNHIIYNTKEVTVYDSIDHYTHTTPLFKYGYLNIPLTVGYRFVDNKKFNVSVNAGVIFHFLTQKEIPPNDFSSPDFTVVQTRDITPERVDWNLRWKLGLRLNYNIARTLSVSAEPVFSKYLNSVYDTDQGYDNVKPYTMGIRFGIYYGF